MPCSRILTVLRVSSHGTMSTIPLGHQRQPNIHPLYAKLDIDRYITCSLIHLDSAYNRAIDRTHAFHLITPKLSGACISDSNGQPSTHSSSRRYSIVKQNRPETGGTAQRKINGWRLSAHKLQVPTSLQATP